MKHRITSLKRVLETFWENELLGATQIAQRSDLSNVIVHKYLKQLLSQKRVKKIGKPPHTKYQSLEVSSFEGSVKDSWILTESFIPDFKTRKILDDIFYKFSPDGRILQWVEWMKQWCISRNLNIKEKSQNYISIAGHIEKMHDQCGLLSAGESFGTHFDTVHLDNIYYADQYKWMEFGRGKLAEMTFYAKQSQNKQLICQAIAEVLPKLECMIATHWFDAIAITPWSITRKNQLLWFLKQSLVNQDLPFVDIVKYYPNQISIPQKSLKTRQQRIENARNTIIVDDENIGSYSRILLIDDFVGSWSTLNETAHKLKQQWVQHVTGFAFVGNLNLDYEIINEV